MTTRYTRLQPQIRCNNCRQVQLATNRYCCNCGRKFVEGLGDIDPVDDRGPFKRCDAIGDWYIPPVTCTYSPSEMTSVVFCNYDQTQG